LQSVSEFKVENEFGYIQFLGETDLTDVDLADAITIERCCVEVYDDLKLKETKPKVGQKLNRAALIHLEGVKPKIN
jgi:hypothetical protein